jgi:hypothetical protein
LFRCNKVRVYEDSPQNAIKVIEDIAKAVNKATTNPGSYRPDKYKINNDGSYRAFEKTSLQDSLPVFKKHYTGITCASHKKRA